MKARKIEATSSTPLKDLLDGFYKQVCRKDIIQPIFLLDYLAEMITYPRKVGKS